MCNIDNSSDSDLKKETTKGQFSIKLVLIPVVAALFIISYEDFLNNVFIQPFLYLLNTTGFLIIKSGTNEYTLFILLLNLILNFASLILIYYVFFKSKLLSKQVENKQYGLNTTIKTYLSLFVLVMGIGLIITAIQRMYFTNISTTSPYDAIFPSSSNYPYYNLFLVIILVCIFAPILEELTFRRILIPLLEGTSYVSTSYAVVISATVFAFIHSEADLLDGSIYFAIVHFTSAFILGLGLAGIYVTTRNVKYSIFYHSMNNTLAVISTIVSAYFVTDVNNPNPNSILVFYEIFVLVLVLAGSIIFIISLFSTEKIKYPLKNQFKGNLELKQMMLAIIVILIFQGIVFIIIPTFEEVLFATVNFGLLTEVVLNGLIYIGIFLFFVLFLIRNSSNILGFAKVQNQNLPPFVNPKHMAFQYTPYGYQNMNQQYLNQPPYQNMYQQYPNQPIYQNMNQQAPNQSLINIQNNAQNQQTACPNCKNIIPSKDVNFCPFCGFKLK